MNGPGKFDDDDDFPRGSTREKPAARVSSPPSTPPTDGFPVVWLRDAEFKLETHPILKGLIEPGAFVIIYGPSGSGKSFFTADIAQHIATGAAWRGRRVRKSLVVYVASEAGSSILKRFVAWRDNRVSDEADIPLAILTRGPNLLASMDVEKLVAQLRALCTASGLPLGLVIFDTLSRSIPGGDENTAEDMTMVVKAADILRDEFNAATAYVHHSGKDATRGARGHSALHAAADLVLQVDSHVATVEKVRDGVAGERFPFSLDVIELGLDADGDPVTTCLLNEAETGISRSHQREPRGRNQQVIIGPLRDLILEEGNPMPGTSALPAGVKAVSIEALVARCTPKFATVEPWRARQRIAEAVMGLQAAGFAGVHGDLIWLT